MRKTWTLLFSFAFFFCVSIAFADDAPPPPPPPTCGGSAEFSFVSTGGNTSTQTLGLGGALECKPGLWDYLAKVAFIRSEADDVVNAKSIDALFRAARTLTPRLKGYGQFNYFQNSFAGIDHRYALEGGISYMVLASKKQSLEAAGGLGYTREERVPVPEITDNSLSFATVRLGGVYRYHFSDNAEVGDDSAFTFNLNDGADWRFANVVYVAAKMTSIFSLKVSQGVAYLNQPVPGFEKTDTVTSAALVAKF